ncbi:MAG: hypothetical protein KGQ61_08870 [Planctomycetes bacterium]|nr:hypothetical protein [Planctomycetota bacterium]
MPPGTTDTRPLRRQAVRQVIEVVAIAGLALVLHSIRVSGGVSAEAACWAVTALAAVKTGYFLLENLQHILLATAHEIAYHRFLALMGVNMAQITLSFALDFWLLESAVPRSFSGFDPATMTAAGTFFDCCFYSVLNFSFFGFGEILPQTVPAKLVTLLEVILAFFTVIFLLSDFISLKDSLRGGRPR